MDAQHQKTNKSAQFACYLPRSIHHHRVLHPTFIFSRCCFPPLSICSPHTAHSSRTTRQASKQQREGESFWGRPFFSFFFLVTETKGYDKNYLTLPCLTYLVTNRRLRTAEPWTANCDFETKPLCVITQKWSMHAIICDIQFAHGVNLPIFLVTHPFSFSFSFSFSLFFLLFAHISQCPRHGWRFRYVCFRRQVPGDTKGTYLSYLDFFSFFSFFRHLFGDYCWLPR